MFRKIAGISLMCLCTIVLTTCKQETVATRLQHNVLQANIEGTKLFGYNPDLELVPTTSPDHTTITISAHGYGSNKKRGINLAKYAPLAGHILTLNLPDYDCIERKLKVVTHGTINEILPFLYAVNTALRAGADRINLYGFSAGGGVIVNTLGILNSNRFDNELLSIGISEHDKRTMLKAIENGVVLLDVPLKSMEEIIHGRGRTAELDYIAGQYKENNLRPIDSLDALKGLKLKIVLYFENPDEIIYNNDDAEFIQRLKKANSLGITRVAVGTNGGHNRWHKELWQEYVRLY